MTTTNDQLLEFMSSFRKSMETQIRTTNEKLDSKLEDINKEMADINAKIKGNEDKNDSVLHWMDERLTLLEKEMKKSAGLKEMRDEFRSKGSQIHNSTQGMEDPVNIPTKQTRTSFERRRITEDDLVRDSSFKSTWAKELEEELEEELLTASEEQLDGRSARMATHQKPAERMVDEPRVTDRQRENSGINRRSGMDGQARMVEWCEPAKKPVVVNPPEQFQWNNLNPVKKVTVPRIRKPPTEIKDWFGEDSNEEEEESSSTSSSDGSKEAGGCVRLETCSEKAGQTTQEESSASEKERENGRSCIKNATYDWDRTDQVLH